MAGGAVAILIRREKEVVQAFRDAGATSPASARTLGDLSFSESNAVRRLRRRAVVRETDDGRFYLDEQSWEALGNTRRRMAMVTLIIVLALLIFTLGVTGVFGKR